MILTIKNLFFSFTFNLCLLSLLIIGIQNNSKKSKVDFVADKTIELPIGFIVGTSFISGSIIGGVLNLKISKNN
mgnify:CR=1 FL=1